MLRGARQMSEEKITNKMKCDIMFARGCALRNDYCKCGSIPRVITSIGIPNMKYPPVFKLNICSICHKFVPVRTGGCKG